MALMEFDDVRIHHQVFGDGFPVLLIAPGGMRSTIEFWERTPWNPIEALSGRYRIIAMDQRNAGESTGPVSAGDGWHTYTGDQLRLLDHLGVDQFHVIGMCIGGPYIMGLIEAAPDRVRSAVMLQPIGLDDNRDAFHEMFDQWAAEISPDHPEADDAAWANFKEAMFGGDFLFNTSRDQVAACTTPLLLMMGNDLYHPESTSREIASLARNLIFVEQWKEESVLASTNETINTFLDDNTAAA